MEKHPDKTDLLLYVTGSLSDLRAAAIKKHLTGCSICQASVEALEKEQATFLGEHPFEKTIVPPNLSFKKRAIRHHMPWHYSIAAMLIFCLAAGIFFTMNRNEAGYRTKGGATGLTAYVKTQDGTIEKRDDRLFFPGERIQFVYSCDVSRYFILLGIDTAGTITHYFPASGDSSMALEPGREMPLPNSIVLDNYVGRELFVGIFSKKPFAVDAIKARAKAAFEKSGVMDSLELGLPAAVVVPYVCRVEKDGIR